MDFKHFCFIFLVLHGFNGPSTGCFCWQDLMALLAYEEPEKSPMFHLFSLDRRQMVAEDLNRAILGTSLIWCFMM